MEENWPRVLLSQSENTLWGVLLWHSDSSDKTLQTSWRDGGWLYSEFGMIKSPVLKDACVTLLLC